MREQSVFRLWWPLAASWMLMAAEGPIVNFAIARLPDSERHFAAFGGVLWPVTVLVEAPVLMLLSASTALSRDRRSFELLRGFMHVLGTSLTLVLAILAFTPLFGFVFVRMLEVPEQLVAPAKLGLLCFIPLVYAVGYRRFYQGVMIASGHSFGVGVGTVIRLVSVAGVVIGGLTLRVESGTGIAALAVMSGLAAEAMFVRFVSRSVVRALPEECRKTPLTVRDVIRFYTPLALTSVIFFIGQPLGSGALARMPEPVVNLAIWPLVVGLSFICRSPVLAIGEVVVAFIGRPGSFRPLVRFAALLGALGCFTVGLFASTPLGDLWFRGLYKLAGIRADVAIRSLWCLSFTPMLTAAECVLNGISIDGRRTRVVNEAVIVYFAVTGLLLIFGVLHGGWSGIYVCLLCFSIGQGAQVAWLWWRMRDLIANLKARDHVSVS